MLSDKPTEVERHGSDRLLFFSIHLLPLSQTIGSSAESVKMGLAYNTYLSSNKIYGCKNCKAHLANHEDIISRVRSPSASFFLPIFLLLTGRLPTSIPRPSHMPCLCNELYFCRTSTPTITGRSQWQVEEREEPQLTTTTPFSEQTELPRATRQGVPL